MKTVMAAVLNFLCIVIDCMSVLFACIGIVFFETANSLEGTVEKLKRKRNDGQWPKEVVDKLKQEKRSPIFYNQVSERVVKAANEIKIDPPDPPYTSDKSGYVYRLKRLQSDIEKTPIFNDSFMQFCTNNWGLYNNDEYSKSFKIVADLINRWQKTTMEANEKEIFSALSESGAPEDLISYFRENYIDGYKKITAAGYKIHIYVGLEEKFPYGIGVKTKDDIPVTYFNYYHYTFFPAVSE